MRSVGGGGRWVCGYVLLLLAFQSFSFDFAALNNGCQIVTVPHCVNNSCFWGKKLNSFIGLHKILCFDGFMNWGLLWLYLQPYLQPRCCGRGVAAWPRGWVQEHAIFLLCFLFWFLFFCFLKKHVTICGLGRAEIAIPLKNIVITMTFWFFSIDHPPPPPVRTLTSNNPAAWSTEMQGLLRGWAQEHNLK